MRDETIIRQRLDQLRGQLLQWGTPDLQVFVVTKDELRGWIRALEWVLLKSPATVNRELAGGVRQPSQNTLED